MILSIDSLPEEPPTTTADVQLLYLVDGHSLTFKAYHAIRGLTAPSGQPIGGVYGFLRMLLRLIDAKRPTHLAVVFDTGQPTFRKELFEGYKATRQAPPPDFGAQMEWIYKLLKSMRIPTYHMDGFEADDLIATMARAEQKAGRGAVIVSADKDLLQLVGDRIRVLRYGKEDLEIFDEAAVQNYLGVKPTQVVDWLALVGDSSDNIPGVPSIGEKGAGKLLQEFGSLDALLTNPDVVANERTRKALRENVEQARLSKRLATVVEDVPLVWECDECRFPEMLWTEDAIDILTELGFNSLLKERGITPPPKPATQEQAVPTDYRMVRKVEELRSWVDDAAKAPWLALDTETTDTNPMTAELVGISLSYRTGEAIYIPVGHNPGRLIHGQLDLAVDTDTGSSSDASRANAIEEQIPLPDIRAILSPLLKGSHPGGAPALTAHNAKYDWKILERAGFDLAAPEFDSMVASFVLDPGRASGHGLKSLGMEICGIQMKPITEIIGEGKRQISMADVSADAVYVYASMDADVTLRLTECLRDKLKEIPSLDKLFNEIEIPLIPVLHRMEAGGFAVNPGQLRSLSQFMTKEIERLTKEIWEAAGRQFNIDSPKQIQQVLFEELGLPSGRKTKTGLSTDNDVLEGLQDIHAVAKLILEYRGITKLRSTYADALPKEINPTTRRIHTSFNQTIAQTGRLSSNNPNLQNIPIRSELGKEIRRAFIPDDPSHRLLSADYSQIELRILAHVSGDEALRNAYSEARDIHALTASQVFGVEQSSVTSDMRAKAKVINFGIIYGMSAHGLSQRLQIPRAQASQFIAAYFATYPGVRKWIEATLEQGRKQGYVETMLGRRRWVPDLTARNGQSRANAERIAVNAPIQGTSADMIKLAMIAIDHELKDAAPGARMVCQVHDELIFSVPENQTEALGEFVREKMIKALPLNVPVVVDTASGANWAECE